MTEDSPPRSSIPWARLVVESAAIVLSILFAFGIDAWWEDRQEQASEGEYLVRLVGDLHADTTELAMVVRRWSAYEESARVILSFLRADRQPMDDPGALLAHAVVATFDRKPFMESATYEELKGSGGLRLIRDPEVRAAVVSYHRALDSGASFISGIERDYFRYVTSRVPPEFRRLVDQQCSRPDGSYRVCSPSVPDVDARGVLDSMIRDPAFLLLVNLRVAEVAMARQLLESRLMAGIEALQTLESALEHR